jgi:hypothetical protein
MTNELTQKLLQQWQAAAEASNRPDPNEPAQQFADFITAQLNNDKQEN